MTDSSRVDFPETDEHEPEGHERAVDGVADLLEFIEPQTQPNPDQLREGLEETPGRVVSALSEMCVGYQKDPERILSTTFAMDDLDPTLTYNGMVVLRGIEMFSLCEHHLLPFVGEASVAYIPEERVVGLSKLARLVDCFARRLQCQERITAQVVDSLMDHLDAKGAAVVVDATHFCMKMRGVGKKDASMVTSEVRGNLRHDSDARAEVFRLLQIH